MSKRNTPDPERAEKFVAEYQQKFSEAITQAREAAATTNTPAWQANYAMQLMRHREVNRLAVKSIRELAEHVGLSGSSEIDEKAMKECVKTLADERLRFSHWEETISNFKKAVEDCRVILDTALVAVRNAEDETPLINRGLATEVRKLLAKWPTATWDDESGVATVTEPDSAAASNAA